MARDAKVFASLNQYHWKDREALVSHQSRFSSRHDCLGNCSQEQLIDEMAQKLL